MKKPTRLGVKIALAIISCLLVLTMFFPAVKVSGENTSNEYWVTGVEFIKGTFMSKEDLTEFINNWEDNTPEDSSDNVDQLFVERPDVMVSYIRWASNAAEQNNITLEITESDTVMTGYSLLALYIVAGIIFVLSLIRFFALDKTFKWIGFSFSIISLLLAAICVLATFNWYSTTYTTSNSSFGLLAFVVLAVAALVLTILSTKKTEKIKTSKKKKAS